MRLSKYYVVTAHVWSNKYDNQRKKREINIICQTGTRNTRFYKSFGTFANYIKHTELTCLAQVLEIRRKRI